MFTAWGQVHDPSQPGFREQVKGNLERAKDLLNRVKTLVDEMNNDPERAKNVPPSGVDAIQAYNELWVQTKKLNEEAARLEGWIRWRGKAQFVTLTKENLEKVEDNIKKVYQASDDTMFAILRARQALAF